MSKAQGTDWRHLLWRRGRRVVDPGPPSRWIGSIFPGRDSEADLSGDFGRRALRPHRHSLSGHHGTICRRGVTICGGLIVLGLFTRLAAIPLIVIMVVAIVSTKIPILLGHDFWIFHPPKLPRYGFWSMAHEARADFCMLLGSLYLLIEGGGRWSLDALLSKTPQRRA